MHVSSQLSVMTQSIHVHVGAIRRIMTKTGILSGLKWQILKHRQVSFVSYCQLPQQHLPVHGTQRHSVATICPQSRHRRGQLVLSNTAPGLNRSFSRLFYGMCNLAEVKWKVNGCKHQLLFADSFSFII